MEKGIHDGHRQRLKDRFLSEGLASFEDHNILELLLFFSIPRRDTNEIAHELLNRFGSLSAVFDASPEALQTVEGIGESSAVLLHMIPQLSTAYRMDKLTDKKNAMTTEEFGEYFCEYFTRKNVECLVLVTLDNYGRIIGFDEIYTGNVRNVPVDVSRILSICTRKGAAAAIIAHNHPGGRLQPSDADLDATKRLGNLLDSVGVKLKEHFLVVGEGWLPINRWKEMNMAKYYPTFIAGDGITPLRAECPADDEPTLHWDFLGKQF